MEHGFYTNRTPIGNATLIHKPEVSLLRIPNHETKKSIARQTNDAPSDFRVLNP